VSASHDLFLSYRWADRPDVEPLLVALCQRGVRVWQDAREVDDLGSIQQAVATGLSGSRALLAWYSARYNESRACQWELTSAYVATQGEGDPRQRILVVNPEAGNAHVHLPELFDQLHLGGAGMASDAAAVLALAERIYAALGQVPITAFGSLRSLVAPMWLPAVGTGSNRFVGRLREMWQLHGALQAGQSAMLTGTGGKPGLALIRGAGGTGKSLMAEEYALRFGAAYPGGVFWLRAFGHPDGGNELSLTQRSTQREAQILDIAGRLGIDTVGLGTTQVQGTLARHFAGQGQPFLWVVDDLPPDPGPEGLAGWRAPHPLGRTLFTTRSRRFSHVAAIELPQLEPDDARRLLTRQRPLLPADASTADAICGMLGHHALAVDVTAALVDRRGLTTVLQDLQHPTRDALALAAQFDEALPNGHQREISATFLASIYQLGKPARELLRHAAVLAVAPIPSALLVKSVAANSRWWRLGIPIKDADARDEVDLGLSQLLSAGLAEDAGNCATTVHTLVSRTVRFASPSPNAWRSLRGLMIGVLSQRLVEAGDIRRHVDLVPWVTHARELSESPRDAPTAFLLGWVAQFDIVRGNYPLARLGFESQFEAYRRMLGDEHPDTLRSMHNLAFALVFQGDLPSARRLQEAVLNARRRLLGEEHSDTLASMVNLAMTLDAQGDLPGARRLLEAVLEAMRRVLGEEHPDTLTSMGNLAMTLQHQGDLPGARRLQEAVLEARMRALGKEHPDTLTSMNNLASTLGAQGDLPGARRLNEAVLDAMRRVLGVEHPTTLASMNNLADTLWNQGDLAGARVLQEQVLEARRRLLGAEHPDTLTSMNNLASTLSGLGDLPVARRLLESVLEARRRLLGEDHPDNLLSMGNLAVALWTQGETTAARQLMKKTADGRLRALGAAHPDTEASVQMLARMHGD